MIFSLQIDNTPLHWIHTAIQSKGVFNQGVFATACKNKRKTKKKKGDKIRKNL
jgi:hypothetical protein